ncbi:BON domain-containing protein [Snuella lapsa]|uniref:BON domain-containing protein n=1 Tax=Snuella lapsa TaxID=870481 RepID=A0ABP6X4G1_9FLAO
MGLTKDKATVKLENGWVSLDGELPWNYQREDAKKAVRYLSGVKGLSNNIKIKSKSNDSIEKSIVEKVLRRSSIDDSYINVKVSGTTVTLSGKANS